MNRKAPKAPRAALVPPLATLRYGAAGEAGGLPEGPPPPPGPQGRRRCHPSPHCATARRGRPEAYPKSRPHPQDPKGGAGTTPRHTARLRHGAARAPGGPPEGPPQPPGPQGRHRRHPSSPCATARRGRPEAYPQGRPYCQRSDPAPPEIGRGSKRALTHRAGKSNRLT